VHKRGLPESVRMKHDLHYVDELFHDQNGATIGRYIAVDLILPNPNQPRQNIGDLTDLIASIREKGVLEPLLVRPMGDTYQLIAGERRWRACKELGISIVPCIEKNVDDREMMEIALIENLQRKDLTPFEEAEGLQVLSEKFHYTHAQVAQVIGKARTSVTETLSLNQMPAEIREMCRLADITNKSLLLHIVRQPGVEEMKQLIERISREQLTRQEIRDDSSGSSKPSRFTYQYKGKSFTLKIQFQQASATSKDVQAALEETLEGLSDTSNKLE
jgi:ParB family chromosome partitioning protein